MRLKLPLIAAMLASLSTVAMADEYIVTLEEPIEGVSDGLFKSLKIEPLDSFELNGVPYVVLNAPSVVHIETLFSVYGKWPIAVGTFDSGWSAFADTPLERRLLQSKPMHCRFCLG